MAQHKITICLSDDLMKFVDSQCKARSITPSLFFKTMVVSHHGLPLEWINARKPKETAKNTGLNFDSWENNRIERQAKEHATKVLAQAEPIKPLKPEEMTEEDLYWLKRAQEIKPVE